jgi:hypothetical protein
MNKKVYNGIFGLLMIMCVSLIILVKYHGITGIEIFLAILYVAIGGFFMGLSWNKKTIKVAKV